MTGVIACCKGLGNILREDSMFINEARFIAAQSMYTCLLDDAIIAYEFQVRI